MTSVIVARPPGTPPLPGVASVEGGAARSESVRLALAAAPAEEEVVLVHDAARPLAPPVLWDAVAAAIAAGADGAVAAAPVTDTIKEAAGPELRVVRTLERAGLWAVQTPQGFRREALARALDVAPEVLAAATDDAGLVERAGGRVVLVPAPRENLKVTTPLDLRVAELLLADRGST